MSFFGQKCKLFRTYHFFGQKCKLFEHIILAVRSAFFRKYYFWVRSVSFFDFDKLRIQGRMHVFVTVLKKRVLTLPHYSSGPELFRSSGFIDLQHADNMLVTKHTLYNFGFNDIYLALEAKAKR